MKVTFQVELEDAAADYRTCAETARTLAKKLALSTADRDAIREALKEANEYIGRGPHSWPAEQKMLAKLTAALGLIEEG